MSLIGKQEAFTLIEVLLALILMGLIVGITLPNFNQLLESVDHKAANRQVINLFKKMQSKAVTSGRKQEIILKQEQFVYYTQAGEKITFGRGIKEIKLKKGSNPICFYPNGRSSGVQLLLITDTGNKMNINLDKITAQAVVEELE